MEASWGFRNPVVLNMPQYDDWIHLPLCEDWTIGSPGIAPTIDCCQYFLHSMVSITHTNAVFMTLIGVPLDCVHFLVIDCQWFKNKEAVGITLSALSVIKIYVALRYFISIKHYIASTTAWCCSHSRYLDWKFGSVFLGGFHISSGGMDIIDDSKRTGIWTIINYIHKTSWLIYHPDIF